MTKKQKETWRGRAQLRLEERATQWSRHPQSRYLPSLFEYSTIVAAVPRRKRTVEQRRMMRAATRHHAWRWGSLLMLLVASGGGLFEYKARQDREHMARQRAAAEETAKTRVSLLANADASGVPYTIEALESLRDFAIPKLRAMFSDTNAKPRERLHAACALAKFGDAESADEVETFLIDIIPTADGTEAKNIVAALRATCDPGIRGQALRNFGIGLGQFRNSEVPDPGVTGARIIAQLAKRAAALPIQATVDVPDGVLPPRLRYAAVALYLGDPSVLSPLVQLGPDPTERTALTLRLKDWLPDDLANVREILATTEDEPLCSVVCAAIGRFPPPADPDNDPLVAVLKDLFVNAPDGGTHGAIDWTLRQWSVALPQVGQAFQPDRTRADDTGVLRQGQAGKPDLRWYVNSVGMTLVEIPAGKHQLTNDRNFRYEVELTRPVYLSNREVTVAQFLAFANDPNTPPDQKPQNWEEHDKTISPTDDCPVQQINWGDSTLYCNWLSRKEGLTPCYNKTGKTVINLSEIVFGGLDCDFTANGYRLPTEAEWEVTCRAGTTTSWNCGKDDVELREFAMFRINSRNQTWASGTKLPNGWGLFDMHGNVWEWCWDWYRDELRGGVNPRGPSVASRRTRRGGGWSNDAAYCRSAVRSGDSLSNRNLGFRLALGRAGG